MEQDLESALTRYDDIWRGMEARRIIVETTLLQIERYRKMIRNVTILLYKVEKKVSKLEPIGGDLDTVQRQLLEHKVMNISDISRHFLQKLDSSLYVYNHA